MKNSKQKNNLVSLKCGKSHEGGGICNIMPCKFRFLYPSVNQPVLENLLCKVPLHMERCAKHNADIKTLLIYFGRQILEQLGKKMQHLNHSAKQ